MIEVLAMSVMPFSEAAEDLQSALDLAQKGEPVYLVRDGEIVGEVRAAARTGQHFARDQAEIDEAIARMRERRKYCRLDGLTIRELRDAGKR
jgi:hypothetical protein